MKLPRALEKHDQRQLQVAFNEIERAMSTTQSARADINVVNRRLVLQSPDGTLYQVKVDNTGTLSTVAI